VIAMELVPEGTLKDLVIPDAPMGAAAAVDAILQVVSGLEAAAAVGILHRDIKPSNCFRHRDGRVLVGDFGLSVAASSRDAQGGRAGTILGTPGFASPEQLRGATLDVQSDIYSVGATLFYLLAGRAPFDDHTTTSLLNKIATEPPPSLAVLRPELPRGVAAIVSRCLAKDPADRFSSYAALRRALEPFSTARLVPAPILRRTLAGLVDAWLIGLMAIPIALLIRALPWALTYPGDKIAAAAATLLFMALYYGLLEGLAGASAGKALFGLRVADEHHVAPGVKRAAMRLLVFDGPTQLFKLLAVWSLLRVVPDLASGFVSTVVGTVCLIVLFSTARKKNGYLALHDRWTRTRVVRRRVTAEARERVDRSTAQMAREFESDERVGPFLVPPSTRIDVDAPVRIEGYDDRLQRPVWLEILPAGTAPLAASRRDLGRPTRLRWLAGRRDQNQCWDAYEAVDGAPFETAASAPQPWSRVRHWICDLAQECAAGLADGSLTALDPSRVWIGRDGHARILDWNVEPDSGSRGFRVQAEGPAETTGATDLVATQRFLYGIAVAALTSRPFTLAAAGAPETPLPLSVRSLLLKLRDGGLPSREALLDAAAAFSTTPATYPRSRRGFQMAASAIMPLSMTVVSIGAILVLRGGNAGDRAIFTLDACLNELERADWTLRKGPDPQAQQTKDDVEIYMAEHLTPTIENEQTWSNTFPNVGARDGRRRARQAIEARRVRTPEEVRRADAAVAKLIDVDSNQLAKVASLRAQTSLGVGLLAGTFCMVAFFAGVGALLLGSGFTFRPFGAALVNRRGQRISRIRAVIRAAITWSPVIALGFLLKLGPDITDTPGPLLALQLGLLALFAAFAAWAIARPSRGIQDRMAGTWIVPR
jgi:hypothetical protein